MPVGQPACTSRGRVPVCLLVLSLTLSIPAAHAEAPYGSADLAATWSIHAGGGVMTLYGGGVASGLLLSTDPGDGVAGVIPGGAQILIPSNAL
jgi:hypothetical protein